MWYLIDSWKLLSENPQAPLKKSTPLFLLTPPLKIQKVQVPSFLPKLKIFQASLCRKGGREVTVVILIQEGPSSKILFYFYFILCWQLKNIRIKIHPTLLKYANKIQRNLNLILNTNVSTKNLLYFLNLNCSYFIINLDQ